MKNIDTSNALILIVDDTPANITVLSDALKTDYRVKIATSGQAALDILKKGFFRLLVESPWVKKSAVLVNF